MPTHGQSTPLAVGWGAQKPSHRIYARVVMIEEVGAEARIIDNVPSDGGLEA